MAALIWASMSWSELPSVMCPCKVTTAVEADRFSMVALSGMATLYPKLGDGWPLITTASRTDEWPYFHSHIFDTVPPLASTSNSKAAQALLSLASFFDADWKNNMPR